jgi:hypothetical protein
MNFLPRRTAPAQEDAGAARLRGPRANCAATARRAPAKDRGLSALLRSRSDLTAPGHVAPALDCRRRNRGPRAPPKRGAGTRLRISENMAHRVVAYGLVVPDVEPG